MKVKPAQPKFKGLSEDEKKILRFELDYQRRMGESDADRRAAMRLVTCFDDKKINDTIKPNLQRLAYKPFKMDAAKAKKLIGSGESSNQYWVYLKLDFQRGDLFRAIQRLAGKRHDARRLWEPDGKVENESRTDFIIRRIYADSNAMAAEFKNITLVDVHSLMGHYYDLAVIILAKSELTLYNWVSSYAHGIPEVAHSITATRVFQDDDFDFDFKLRAPDDAGKMLRSSSDPTRKTDRRSPVTAIQNRQAVAKFLLGNQSFQGASAETIHEAMSRENPKLSMTSRTCRNVLEWLHIQKITEEKHIDYYGSRFGINGVWPTRYLVMIKTVGNSQQIQKTIDREFEDKKQKYIAKMSGGRAAKNYESDKIESEYKRAIESLYWPYQHILIGKINKLFYNKNPMEKAEPAERHAEGITLLDVSKLISFDYSIVLTILADTPEDVSNFVTGYLHTLPEVMETHTVTSLVLRKFRDLRDELEEMWTGKKKKKKKAGPAPAKAGAEK